MEPKATIPRALGTGAALVTVSQLVAALSAALVGVAVARLLGPEGMGAYAVAATLLLSLTALATLGLESGVVYPLKSRRVDSCSARSLVRG